MELKMNPNRIFSSAYSINQSAQQTNSTLVLKTETNQIRVWHVPKDQEVPAHIHQYGQDTWIILSGSGKYYLGNNQFATLKTGDIAVANAEEVHGAINVGEDPLIFISITAAEAGFKLTDK